MAHEGALLRQQFVKFAPCRAAVAVFEGIPG